jgi:hypothetical protein
MRILFAIAHYFNPAGDGRYGSVSPNPQPRIQALSSCIATLHQTYGRQQRTLNIAYRQALPANQQQSVDLEIVVCTTGKQHLLDQLIVPAHWYTHVPTNAEPMLLGFECQAALRERLGLFEYFCFLEDDLLLRDPWFFFKLQWFVRQAGSDCLLQPHRYEQALAGPVQKLYIDGDLLPRVVAPYRNLALLEEFSGNVLGTPIRFVPARNPHSGSYFLSAEQLAHWTRQPHFLDRDTSFVGPLESAATLGILKTFKIYKPAVEQAGFLEIQHFGSRFLSVVGRTVPIADAPPGAG